MHHRRAVHALTSVAAMGVMTLTLLTVSEKNAAAYPTSVVFAPTGETRPLGKVGGFAYGGSVLSPAPKKFTVAPWMAVQGGVMPSFTVAKGVEIGGAEVGFDVFGPGDGTYKPVLNGKLSLLKQVGWVPSIGVGMMQLAPAKLSNSLNMGYVSLTETIVVPGKGEGTNLGAVTVGWGRSFMQAPADPTAPLFHGTFPFGFDSRNAPILGYSSPSWHGLNFGIEHIGGYSEMSGNTAGVFYAPTSWVFFGAGAFMGNDRRQGYRADGIFSVIGVEVELVKKKDPAAPPPPPPNLQGKN